VAVLALMLAVPVYFGALPAAHAAAPGNAELAPGGVDQNAGAFTTSVAITVPSFHGLEPKLGLVYSSSGPNGQLGLGWQLAGASKIERFSPGRGAPTYTASDVFLLDGEEIVASTGLGGTYVTKRQNFERISFDAVANAWTVTSKDGTKSQYAARFDIATGKTVRWMLSSVTDLHANTVTYGYTCDGVLECYLHVASYNGTTVTFYHEVRPDPYSYSEGVARARMNWRVMTVDVVVSGSRARTYGLAYTTSPTTGRSLLSSVTRYGRDAVVDTTGTVTGVIGKITGGSHLPPVTFTYKADTNTLVRGSVATAWCPSVPMTGDFNGDGKTDLFCHIPLTSQNVVAMSNGASGFTGKPAFGPWCGGDIATGDFNGDGKTDLWCHNTTTFNNTIALSNGAGGFTSSPSFVWCPGAFGVGDFNGDGKADLWCHNTTTFNNSVQLSNGLGGFTAVAPAFGPFCDGSIGAADFNGDGRTDLWCVNTLTGQRRIALSNGAGGFTAAAAVTGWCASSPQDTFPLQFGAADFNGDGAADMWCHNPNTAADVLALSNGTGVFGGIALPPLFCPADPPINGTDFATVDVGDFNGDGKADLVCNDLNLNQSWTALSNGVGGYVYGQQIGVWCFSRAYPGAGDFNGDGKTDLTCHDPVAGTTWVAWSGTPGRVVDRMSTVTNELGGVTTVTYTPASTWPVGTTGAGLIQPPSALPTVSQVQVGDGLGHTVTTNYAYSGGRWDSAERRFLGYSQVTATDASGAYSVTAFQIEAGYPANRVVSVQRFSPTGVLVESSSTSYTESTTAGVYTSLVASTTHGWCQGATLCQTTRTDVVSYDGYGNPTQINNSGDIAVAADDKTTITTFAYDPAAYAVDRPSTVTVRAGLGTTGAQLRLVQYGYNAAGDVTSTSRWLNTTNANVGTSATYDAFGNKVSATDEIGKVTSWTYDPTYNTFQTGQCQGLATCGPTVCTATALCSTQAWDVALGLPSSSTDVNAAVTSWQYDTFGRVTLETRPDASSTSTSYVSWGTPGTEYVQTAVSDGTADGLWSRTFPDGQGRTIKTVAEPDITVLTTYNPQGLVGSVSNPFKGAAVPAYTTYGYDAAGRQITLTHPDGSTVNTTYAVVQNPLDADFATPRLTKLTCTELGTCTRLAYDGAGHDVVTSEWDGVGTASTVPEYRTHAVFDVLGNNTTVTDSLGNVSTMGWDSLGRKTSTSDPDTGLWTYGYDAAGHVTSQVDANKKALTSAYNDPLGRLTSVNAGATVLLTNHYDEAGHGAGKGRLTSMTDTSGSTTWSYDTLGRTTAQTKTIGGVAYTVGQVFDIAGRRKSLTYPDGQIVAYAYDASGCLTTVGTYVTAATCTPTQNTQTLGNGVVTAQNFDPNRMWQSSDSAVKGGTTVLQSEFYSYRADGRVSAKTSSDTTDQWTYGYDNLGRLTAATNTTNTAYSSSYAYDQIGRITSDSGAGAGLGTRTYPAAGTGHIHAPSTAAAGTVSYTYDAAGNVTNNGATYGYDAQNRLASFTANGVTTTYTYDGQGTRVQAGTTKFVELGGQLLYQIDGTASSDFIYYGAQRTARRDSTGTVSYYIGDRLGSPHLILDATGAVQRTVLYGPYGMQLAATGTLTDPFGQAGDYRDPSGLYKRGIRYQAARTTMFTSPDPSGSLDPASPQTLNRYTYAGNDPINFVDHTGRLRLGFPFGTVGTTTNVETHRTSLDVDILGIVSLSIGPGENPGDTTTTIGVGLGKALQGEYSFTTGRDGWTGFGANLAYEIKTPLFSEGLTAKLDMTNGESGALQFKPSLEGSFGILGHKVSFPANEFPAVAGIFVGGAQRAIVDLFLNGRGAAAATAATPESGSPFESSISAEPVVDENGFGYGIVRQKELKDWSSPMPSDGFDPDCPGYCPAGNGQFGRNYGTDGSGFDLYGEYQDFSDGSSYFLDPGAGWADSWMGSSESGFSASLADIPTE
jgi:RHS repeat-associated protein